MEETVGSLDKEQLTRLAQYFDEKVTFSRHIKSKVEEVEPGKAVCNIDVESIHLNGNGTLHGGVYASLIDNAMGLSVAALVGLRTATIGLDVHFLGAVREGRITCSAGVVHRTRRIATVEARVRDGDGNLVAMGTGTFRIFEKRGDPIV
jgi:uncharacterized protein (TIGR00369 family)